jgi:hypothetical protein
VLAGLIVDEPVVHLGRVARIQQRGIVVELPQLALARLLAEPMHGDISTTTPKQLNWSDFSVSHRACSSNASRCDNKFGSYLRDLVLFLPGKRITKTVEGHMRTDDRWPTSVFNECRQCDGFWGVGVVCVDGIRAGDTLMGSTLGGRRVVVREGERRVAPSPPTSIRSALGHVRASRGRIVPKISYPLRGCFLFFLTATLFTSHKRC